MKVWIWKCEIVEVILWKWKCGSESLRVWKCDSESVKVKVWKWECESESVKVRVWKWDCESETLWLSSWMLPTRRRGILQFWGWPSLYLQQSGISCNKLLIGSFSFYSSISYTDKAWGSLLMLWCLLNLPILVLQIVFHEPCKKNQRGSYDWKWQLFNLFHA